MPSGFRSHAWSIVGSLGRHYRYPGQRAFSLVARLIRRLPPADEVAYTDIDGYERRADLRDHMESLVFVGRHRLPAAVAAAVRPGDWTIDVGANVGSISGQLCRAVGPTGLVWAFEPIPRNVDRLQQLVEANDLGQLRIFPCALSSAQGTAAINLGGDGFSGHASFTASWIRSGKTEVTLERLDDLTAGEASDRPLRLVKIDVEGFEQEVLEGAEHTIRRFRPAIYCEFNDIVMRDAGRSSESLVTTFRSLGYAVAPAWHREASRLAGRNTDLLMIPVESR